MSSSYHGNISSSSAIESKLNSSKKSTNFITPYFPANHSNQLLEMTKSLYENFTSDNLMTQSLDPTILSCTQNGNGVKEQSSPVNNGLYNGEFLIGEIFRKFSGISIFQFSSRSIDHPDRAIDRPTCSCLQNDARSRVSNVTRLWSSPNHPATIDWRVQSNNIHDKSHHSHANDR
jgi:hypothetical protein